MTELKRGLRQRIPELLLVGLGIAIRVSMVKRFDVRAGYDASAHWPYVQWFQERWTLPPLNITKEFYHPPFYYALTGAFARVVPNERLMGIPSIIFGCLTLMLLWWGLERHLPGQRFARRMALALMSVLPASVHLAGMMTAEALNGFLAVLALLLAAELLDDRTNYPAVMAQCLGIVLGIEMLTKISALVIIGAIFATAGIQLIVIKGGFRERFRRAAPWVLTLVVLVATSGWYFARNHRLYGKAILSGFDGTDGPAPAYIEKIPYLQRRKPIFFVGWTDDVFRYPFYPSGVLPRPYFWPVLVTSTFVDYYNYAFVHSHEDDDNDPDVEVNTRPLPERSLKYACASAIGGALIALTTVIAWIFATFHTLRRREMGRLLMCVAPFVALIGQLHFVVRYPIDGQGPIKGIYMQFATASLFAIFGLGVAAMKRDRWLRPFAFLELIALVAVATYTIYGRVTW